MRMKQWMGGWLAIVALVGLAGCGGSPRVPEPSGDIREEAGLELSPERSPAYSMEVNEGLAKADGIRPGYGTTYEVFVYSFYDSDGDGIGDIRGVTEKLDYISEMGFDGIWLMPIMPSATYHKYDVTNYYDIDKEYGTMEDFEELTAACEERGIRVIMDLVINHSSSKHPWFTAACEYLAGLDGKEPSEEECPEFGYYHFSREKESKYHQVPGTDDWYYEGQFWSEMPDLNLGKEGVRAEIEKVTAFWLDKGVDGFRLDAAKEFYSGTHSANLEVLAWFSEMTKGQKEDVYLVAEVWSDLATYASYYSSGIDSTFDFAFADSSGVIADTVKGSLPASGFGKALVNLQERLEAYNPDYIDAPFYTNHDMGRSAGYYSGEYAQNQVKIAGGLNLLMSGNAFVYYGEELGMKGSGKDENKRAPMYWSQDRQAEGTCEGPPNMDNVKMKYPSLAEQQEDPYSIYHYFRQAIKMRNAFPAIIQGAAEELPEVSSQTVAAFRKTDGEETVTVICNLSPETQEISVGGGQGKEAGQSDTSGQNMAIKAALLVDAQPAEVKGEVLTLPGYGIVILESLGEP